MRAHLTCWLLVAIPALAACTSANPDRLSGAADVSGDTGLPDDDFGRGPAPGDAAPGVTDDGPPANETPDDGRARPAADASGATAADTSEATAPPDAAGPEPQTPDAAGPDPEPPTPDAARPPPDRDADGVPDAVDVCPDVPDPAQADRDADGLGDACDTCPGGGPAGDLDTDADGQTPCGGDCDDQRADVYRGAPEVCDGLDQSCDGRVDEGTLNACGACGPAPAEQCNQRDDDCDGQIDEDLAGCFPPEICDGLDQDRDGLIDEELPRPCIVWLGQSEAGGEGRGLGQVLVAAGDLNGDGVPDVAAAAPRRSDRGGALYALSGRDGATLWRVDGEDRLGAALGAGTFFGDGQPQLVATAPDANRLGANGRLVLFDAAGQVRHTDDGFVRRYGEALAAGAFCEDPARTCLALGEPGHDGFRSNDQGRVQVLTYGRDLLGSTRVFGVDDWTGDFEGQSLGARVHRVADFDGNGQDEFIASRLFGRDGEVDRESALFVAGVNGTLGVLQPPSPTDATYAQTLAEGTFFGDGDRTFAFGAPGASGGDGTVFLVGSDVTFRARIDGADEAGYGAALAALPLAEATWLAIGANAAAEVLLSDLAAEVFHPVVPPAGVAADTGYGVALAAFGPLPDGTSRLFVGEPGHDGARGRVHVFSVR